MAKEKYKEEVIKRETELGFKEDWNVPESLPFGNDDVKEDRERSIMYPFYYDKYSKRDTSLLSVIKKGNRKIIHGEKGNMALKSVESQNVEFKSNCCEGYNAV
jgi:hypothetical protein